MPYICQLVDLDEVKSKGGVILPGFMWYAPWYIEGGHKPFILSNEYYRDWYDKRPPIVIVLPSGDRWMIDMKFSDMNGGFKENGWVITGKVPKLTAMPSINSVCTIRENGYHGWLKDGVLSDDLEGRTYKGKWG